ncbi:Nn.00g061690.m01.CDS01 [Neocucurbitaria sp. VM-36]
MLNHGQTSFNAHDKATRHPSSDYSKVRERLSERISPPPLKRRRTGSAVSSPDPEGLRSTVLPIRSPSSLSDIKRSSRVFNVRPVHNGNDGRRVSQQARHSRSSLAQPVDRDHESLRRSARIRQASVPAACARKAPPQTTIQSSPVQGVKGPTMTVVESLRSLRGLIRCLSGNRIRRSSGSIATRTPKAYSVLSPISGTAGRETLPQQLQTNLAPTSGSVNVSTGVTWAHSLLHPLSISSDQLVLDDEVLDGSIRDCSRSKKNLMLFERHDANIPERTEVPDTPTQRSSQLVAPDSASEQLFTDSIGASVGIVSPLTKPHQSGKTSSSTVLCSVCQKQRVLATDSSDSVMCRNCRNRLLIVESGKLEIPETPDATPACEADTRGEIPVAPAAAASTPASATNLTRQISIESKNRPCSMQFPDPYTQKSSLHDAEWMNDGSCKPTSQPVRSSGETCTIRHMAQIALVAANGAYLTTSQIANWIASAFPRVRRGEGEWKASLTSMLLYEQEFRSQQLVGGQGKQKFWGFSNAKVRAWYENKHATYHLTPNSTSKMLRASLAADKSPQKKDQVLIRSTKADQAAPSQVNNPPDMLMSSSEALPHSGKIIVLTDSRNDSLYMPFERHTLRKPQGILNFNHNAKRETSFYKVFPRKRKLSIDTMSSAEKAKRIAEIKTRPSRKRFFGSDYRLAHVRRFGRQDIHDESDGAWVPSRSDRSMFEFRLDKVGRLADNEEFRSLREVLDLPENAIPMNDGQTELAFRDGTLVNEKLPRPRQLYKVGKLVGGDLTIRTS